MELFKTAAGSWIYPEPSLLRIGGVPLFSGFMYAAVGSYLARVWRIFDFRFGHYPSQPLTWLLAAAIYVNFFAHHWLPDIRLALFAAMAALFWRTRVWFTVWREPRWMPLLVGFFLVALFIWFAENLATYSRAWTLSQPAERLVAGFAAQAGGLVPADVSLVRAGRRGPPSARGRSDGMSRPSAAAHYASRALALAWERSALPEPTLLPADLLAAAIEAETCDDFGPDHWRSGFALLADGLNRTADLNPLGRAMAHGQVVKALRERLRAQALWRARPDMLAQTVAAPVIVLGSMRSGTTRIQRLLACDPRLAHTRMFELLNPVPPARFGHARRAAQAWLGLSILRRFNPEIGAIHPTGVLAPEEEFGLYAPSFAGAQFETQWCVPAFARHWEQADRGWVYAEFRAMVQTLAWAQGGDGSRPRVLKAPQFMQDLAELLAVFPDARLVCLSRDAVDVVASSASLVWNTMRVQSDRIDPHWVGSEWLRKTRTRVDTAAAVRARHPHVQQIDVRFADVSADWRGEMRRIYAFLGLPLTPEVEGRMARYLARDRRHAAHGYDPARFGLDPAAIRAALPGGA